MAYELQTLTNNLDASLTAVSKALPKDFNHARFLQNTIAVIKNNPQLTKYNSNDLLSGALRGAYLGLDFMSSECWLVPYGQSVNFQIGYKGAQKLAKKYSVRPLADIFAKEVRQGDELDYGIRDNKPYIEYKPLPFNDGEFVGCFAMAIFKDGGILYEVMSKADVDKIRKTSKAGQSGPWKDFYGEMAKKTVLLRLSKQIEIDFESVEQRESFDEGNKVDFDYKPTADVHDPFATKEEDVIDSVAVEIDSMETPFDKPEVK